MNKKVILRQCRTRPPLSVSGQNADEWLEKGKIFYSSGDYDSVIECWTEAINQPRCKADGIWLVLF
ncbi:MAG: hypothetical protein Pg6C_07740 [Treponemataceae bacterium]|nr:MAG: hypothetical protein Pg6C_07740 [Treponemataceae bacterium]